MRAELKDSEDTGFIIDVFDKTGELIETGTYWFSDLEEQYRGYCLDLAEDLGSSITNTLGWYEWLETEKRRLKEVMIIRCLNTKEAEKE